ncbi:3-oxoacyl-ACP synthase [Streptomyces sp. NBC_01214]|uniref:beta-ketoacyl synthase N-terminal-like domain-containing protein n=1 Tax=Streptomyces sp. NBC_01214 TaxID=2903777 RepID=UPI0022575522|nr:beta-ketoacyl synthase N-terminal-like domain-containing protein [Streptomyces sp. NBC_01214]MCX4803092.1 3-oxoacyl-ACP synthase [Streptomyces sp. NBC_01214]
MSTPGNGGSSAALTTVVITGVGVLVPGADSPESLLAGPPAGAPAIDPAALVGKKGLRFKDRATQLAYCLAQAALRDTGLLGTDGLAVPGESVGVVASSNFGNLDTVARALDTIRSQTVSATSPMDLPNASSNVVASSTAIRFGLRGPNLMVCNGATSGLDALHWGATMITSGRADRVLVIGVEPDNEVVRRLLGDGRTGVDGGAAVVLERHAAARDRSARVRAVYRGYAMTRDVRSCVASLAARGAANTAPARWHAPAGDLPDDLLPGVPRDGFGPGLGEASGALGVLQAAAATGWFDGGGSGSVYAVATAGPAGSASGVALLAPTGSHG